VTATLGRMIELQVEMPEASLEVQIEDLTNDVGRSISTDP
jgi:hypothetical protein